MKTTVPLSARSLAWAALAVTLLVGVACAPTPSGPSTTTTTSTSTTTTSPPSGDQITCASVTGRATYLPGASNAGVDIVISSDPADPLALGSCADLSGAGITAGTFVNSTFTLPDYVCTGEIPGTGVGEIHWSDTSVSMFTAIAVGNVDGNQATLDLTIQSGRFVGAIGSVTITGTPLVGDCLNTPVTSATFTGGPLTLSI